MEITAEQLLALLNQVTNSNQESMKAIVEELQRPAREEALKKAEQLKRKKAQSYKEIMAAESTKRAKQAACSHQKDNGMPSFAGQVNQDGYARLFCQRCLKKYPPVKAPMGWLRSGIGLQAPDNKIMRTLTEEKILKWADWTTKNAPPPDRTPAAFYDPEALKAIDAAATKVG